VSIDDAATSTSLAGSAQPPPGGLTATSSPARLLALRRRRRFPLLAAWVVVCLVTAVAIPGLMLDAAVAAGSLVMLAVTALRLLMVVAGLPSARKRGALKPLKAEAEIPLYTVLVPLFREACMVEPLTRHLAKLDYPPDRLEILLLCEQDDAGTIDQIQALALDCRFRLVVCPPDDPRTKPRACNVGLAQARGEMLVIYDAEDRPAVDQLRRAAAAFAVGERHMVCLQARLAFHNGDHNWLTRCFALEYGALFRLLLPGLAERDLPLPLGGTSNHFRVAALRALDGWDSYNVTEDADLGLRLYQAGWRTRMLDSSTLEEACAMLTPWVRQRTRWMKGYLQTWAVHARNRATSRRFQLATHLVVGGAPVNAALLPVLLSAVLLHTLWWPGSRQVADLLAVAASAALAANVLVQIVSAALAAVVQRQWRLLATTLALPAYSLLISVATYRAVWQLFRQPHMWEKTPHGLSGRDTDPGAAQ
jgi:cellulose synthase/poly-beta-1,6-N-acetylglucosamine synthase-like glycosyltransferase